MIALTRVFAMVDLLQKTLIIALSWQVALGATSNGQQLPETTRREVSSLSWQDLQGVRLEELPAIPGQPEDWKSIDRKRFSIDPPVAAPDFGRRPSLRWKSVRSIPESRAVRPYLFDRDGGASSLAQSEFRTSNWTSVIVGETKTVAHQGAQSPTDPPVGVFARSIPLMAVPVKFVPIPASVATVEELPVKSRPVSLQPQEVSVNLRLLAQRLEAHNLSVAGIEDQLVTREHWDERGLESVISQVNKVRLDRSFWLMYWDLLETHRQRQLGRIASLDSILEKLRQRIFETRVEADLSQASVSTQQHQLAMRRLAEFDRQVVQWQSEER